MPIKQAIQYFFNDNPLVEELVTAGKSATKNFRILDEGLHSICSLSDPLLFYW